MSLTSFLKPSLYLSNWLYLLLSSTLNLNNRLLEKIITSVSLSQIALRQKKYLFVYFEMCFMRIFWWWFNCFSNKIFIFYSNFFYEEADLSHDFSDIDSLVDPSYIDIVLSYDASVTMFQMVHHVILKMILFMYLNFLL